MTAKAFSTRQLCFLLLISAFSTTTAFAHGEDCENPPSKLADGTFGSCYMSHSPCGQVLHSSACEWFVTHGAPLVEYSANGTNALTLGARDDVGTMGAYTCFDFQPNSTYKITFDVVNLDNDSEAQLVIKAATGLTDGYTGACLGTAPSPTTEFLIGTEMISNEDFETRSICFTTDNASYSQLWFYSVYPASGAPGGIENFQIDNIKFEEDIDFSLALNSSTASPLKVCVPSIGEFPALNLQMFPDERGCALGNYKILVNRTGYAGVTHDLTPSEFDDLVSGTLDLTQLFPFTFQATDACYTIIVRSLSDEPTESSIVVCIEMDCECDFSDFEIEPIMGLSGETIFQIIIPGGTTNLGGVLWDMDDGTTSTEITPKRIYGPGEYRVCATIYAINAATGECCEGEICTEFIIEE